MDEDNPTIAIIGAGPIGIETALYARFLGYAVTVYEQGELCEHVRSWGHVQLFSQFGLNSSSLGLSALTAQNPEQVLPSPDQRHTGQEWVEHYLEPLANSDLMRNSIRTKTRVDSIARNTPLIDADQSRHDVPFRLVITDGNGQQTIESAEIVIDATGTWGTANPLGLGGMPAIGEPSLKTQSLPAGTIFCQRVPDLKDISTEGESVFLVIGRGFSAATNVVQLQQIHERDPSIRCIWLTRGRRTEQGPMTVLEDDPLQYRQQLAQTANAIATESDWLDWNPGLEVAAIDFENDRFTVTLSDDQKLRVDHVIANTGFQGDYEMLAALQIHRCYASGGPMAWAASISGTSGDCLQQTSSGPRALLTSEPNFYIVGSKSYGKDPRFLFATGLQQIRDVFRIIAERDTLDLYATLQPDAANG